MKKLLQFTSIFVFTLLLSFYLNPADLKADSRNIPADVSALRKADIPAAPHIMAVRSSSGIDNGNKEYVVSFNPNYGTLNGSSYMLTVNKKLTELPTATRAGYTFRGWYTQSSGGTLVTTNTEFHMDTNVYAQWDNYDAGFRDFYVSNITETSVNITALIPNTYVRTWGILYGTSNTYMSESRTMNLYTQTSALTTSITGLLPYTTYYYRVYYIADTQRIESRIGSFSTGRTSEFTVTFYPNGGTMNGQYTLVTVGQKLPYLPIASRDGYSFDGWYTDPINGALITINTVFNYNGAVYAHWTYAPNNSTSNPSVTPPTDGTTNNGNTNNGSTNNGNTNNGSTNNGNTNNGSSVDTDHDFEPISVERVKLKSVKNNPPRRMKVKWTWYAYGDGYQIAYSTNKNFASSKTKRIFAGVFTDAKTIAGLQKGKTYYVKVRAYQKSGGQRYYGAWSNVKKIKIKK